MLFIDNASLNMVHLQILTMKPKGKSDHTKKDIFNDALDMQNGTLDMQNEGYAPTHGSIRTTSTKREWGYTQRPGIS